MGRYKWNVILCAMLFCTIQTGCKKSSPPQFHYAYFGLEEGRYIIYDVVDITHDQALGMHDTLNYQLKTYWGQAYVDNEGRNAREFHRYVRSAPSDPWVLSDVWYGLIDGIRAELVEENQRIVKLVFAPTNAKFWDANAYNTFAPLECYYSDIHDDKTVGGVLFDSTLIVEQEEKANLIDSVRRYEVYAKNTGLIYHHFKDNHYTIGSSEVVNGKEIYYSYSSSGFE